MALGLIPRARVELVDGEVFQRRVKGTIDSERIAEPTVAFVGLSCTRQGDAKEVQRLEVAWCPGEDWLERPDRRFELAAADLRERTIIRRRPAVLSASRDGR